MLYIYLRIKAARFKARDRKYNVNIYFHHYQCEGLRAGCRLDKRVSRSKLVLSILTLFTSNVLQINPLGKFYYLLRIADVFFCLTSV